MQLLAVSNVYGEEADTIHTDLLALVENPPTGLIVIVGNAGLGADWPVAIWKSAQALTIALTVFSAPNTIKENWPHWKEIYDNAVSLMLEFHGEYRIDPNSAQMIAIHHAVDVLGINADQLEVHMAVRHFRQNCCSYESLLNSRRIDMLWSESAEFGSDEFSKAVQSTAEAAKQATCRYIFGISDFEGCKTIVVEQDGTVSLSADL